MSISRFYRRRLPAARSTQFKRYTDYFKTNSMGLCSINTVPTTMQGKCPMQSALYSDENIIKLAEILDREPDIAKQLLCALSKETRVGLANTVLDKETRSGQTYGDLLSSRHRRKIMVRELSISMGHQYDEMVNDGTEKHMNGEDVKAFLENLQNSVNEQAEKNPTRKQLFQLSLLMGVPFIGFGFVDNAIMLVAGDVIDLTFGRMLGISTLAAAGLGNLISDVAGLGLGGYIEAYSAKIGFQDPKLTAKQMKSRSIRILQFLSTSIGIAIGCLLGMIPLLWMNTDDKYKRICDLVETRCGTTDGLISVCDLQNMFQSTGSILGTENVRIICERLRDSFSGASKITHKEFQIFMDELNEDAGLDGLGTHHDFGILFADTVGLK